MGFLKLFISGRLKIIFILCLLGNISNCQNISFCEIIENHGYDSAYSTVETLQISEDSARTLKRKILSLNFARQEDINLTNKEIKKLVSHYPMKDSLYVFEIKTWFYFTRRYNIKKSVKYASKAAATYQHNKKDEVFNDKYKYYKDLATLLKVPGFLVQDFDTAYIKFSSITSHNILYGGNTFLAYWAKCLYFLSKFESTSDFSEKLFKILVSNIENIENSFFEPEEVETKQIMFQLYAAINAYPFGESSYKHKEEFLTLLENLQPYWNKNMFSFDVIISINNLLLGSDSVLKERLKKLPFENIVKERYGDNLNVYKEIDWLIIESLKNKERLSDFYKAMNE
jgi:hypothetical protein